MRPLEPIWVVFMTIVFVGCVVLAVRAFRRPPPRATHSGGRGRIDARSEASPVADLPVDDSSRLVQGEQALGQLDLGTELDG